MFFFNVPKTGQISLPNCLYFQVIQSNFLVFRAPAFDGFMTFENQQIKISQEQ